MKNSLVSMPAMILFLTVAVSSWAADTTGAGNEMNGGKADRKSGTVSKPTPAERSGDVVRYVAKGQTITVNAYEEKTGAFWITLHDEKAVGPNYADAEALREAIDYDGSFDLFLKNREKMIGTEYQLRRRLRLLTENELSRRRTNSKKN